MGNRIVALDYLRGICACLVMIGHFYVLGTEPAPPPLTLHKLITYSVSVFYILSGIALYSVYYKSFHFDFNSFFSFAVKRIFRILPLLWFVTTITIALNHKIPSYRLLLFNYSGLFGFIEQRGGIARAAWSIGNEMVFYVLFPVFILLIKNKNKFPYYLLAVLTFIPALFITFYRIDESKSVSIGFNYYINPLNQLFLFASGITIAHFFGRANNRASFSKATLLVAVAAFLIYPVDSTIHLLYGIDRMILCAICMVICAMILMSRLNFPNLINRGLAFIGETSYSIYLLHPLVYRILEKIFASISPSPPNPVALFVLSLAGTLVSSYFTFLFLEKPAMKLGARIVNLYSPVTSK